MTDNEDPERLRQDEQTPLVELKWDGWNVEVGPATLYADVPDYPDGEVWGYVSRRNVHQVCAVNYVTGWGMRGFCGSSYQFPVTRLMARNPW